MNPTSLTNRRVLPVSSPKDRLRRSPVCQALHESDIRCLEMMLDQGTCQIVLDRDTREVFLQGVGTGIPFVDSVMKRD